MPSEYVPDRWVMLKLSSPSTTEVYKILAGWSGSYLYGEGFKLNSGCKNARRDGNHYVFEGYSGSIYRCHVEAYGLTSYTAEILEQIKGRIKKSEGAVEVLDEGTDFLTLSYDPSL